MLLLCSIAVTSIPYFTGSVQLYPEHVEAYHYIPTGFAQISVVFNKTDLADAQYNLEFAVKFFANDSHPSFTWAHCLSPSDCGTIYQLPLISANSTSVEEFDGSFWKAHYLVWTARAGFYSYLSTFTPFLFPVDAYSTDLFYISVSDGLPVSFVELRSVVPTPFYAVLTDFERLQRDPPQQLQAYDNLQAGKKYRGFSHIYP